MQGFCCANWLDFIQTLQSKYIEPQGNETVVMSNEDIIISTMSCPRLAVNKHARQNTTCMTSLSLPARAGRGIKACAREQYRIAETRNIKVSVAQLQIHQRNH